MKPIRVVRSVQLGEPKHGCSLCLVVDDTDNAAPVYAVAVRLNDFMGHWPHAHLVTPERWCDDSLRRLHCWRCEHEAVREFEERLK